VLTQRRGRRWNEQLANGRDMLWSPMIRAAMPWLDVFLPIAGRPPRGVLTRQRAERET